MIISAGRRGDQRATLHDQIWRPSMRFERPLARFTAIVPIPCFSSIFESSMYSLGYLDSQCFFFSCFLFTGVLVETRVYIYILRIFLQQQHSILVDSSVRREGSFDERHLTPDDNTQGIR